MKKILTIALLAASLGGCATFDTGLQRLEGAYVVATTATVPAAEAQIALSSFQVIEAAATQYFKYCAVSPTTSACAPGTLDNPGPLRVAIKYDRQGRAARDQIKAAGKTGALISTTVYNLLVSAVTNLSATPVANFGAK